MPLPSTNTPSYSELALRVNIALELSRETQSVEFKCSQRWDLLKIKITKTAIAMSNLREGGMLIIGMRETSAGWETEGVDDAVKVTYEPDDISDFVAKYSSPAVIVNAVEHQHQGKSFVVLLVEPFLETATIVKKNAPEDSPGKSAFYRGDFLIRPSGKVESKKVEDELQMHSILELAAEKRSQRFLRTAQHIGMQLPPESEAQFLDQLKNNDAPKNKFGPFPTWSYAIRGEIFNEHQVESFTRLLQLVTENRVAIRGWDFPCPPIREDDLANGSDYIASFVQFMCCEYWQFWTSGQFYFIDVHRELAHSDWNRHLRQRLAARMASGTELRGVIAFESLIYRYIELHEFIRRLSSNGVFTNGIQLNIMLRNANGFLLVTEDNRLFRIPRRVTSDLVELKFRYGLDEIQQSTKTLAQKAFNTMLERCFGWMNLETNTFDSDFTEFAKGDRRLGWDVS